MKVKIFTAATMQEAIGQVKNALGRDAVILNTRRYKKGGIFGFFGAEVVEVLAAVDDKQNEALVGSSKLSLASTLAMQHSNKPDVAPSYQTTKQEANHATTANIANTATVTSHIKGNVSKVETDIVAMKKMIEKIVDSMPVSKEDLLLDSHIQNLLSHDIDGSVVTEIVASLKEKNLSSGTHETVIEQLIADKIKTYLQQPEGINVSLRDCAKVAFIGPTGVGKTTTIAKLAAHFTLKLGYKVALITADTYRIAAVQQLKTYTDIIGIPLEIVYSSNELKSALERHKDKNLILLDTAGRSPKNLNQIAELKEILSVASDMEVHLVISSTTRTRDALDIVNSFSVCTPNKYIFTKVDEASNLGTLINVMAKCPKKLSYITTGQNVPDDIEIANPQKLVSLILRDSYE